MRTPPALPAGLSYTSRSREVRLPDPWGTRVTEHVVAGPCLVPVPEGHEPPVRTLAELEALADAFARLLPGECMTSSIEADVFAATKGRA